MNVLIHGTPFFCDDGIVRRYAGQHDLRTLGPDANHDFAYSPLEETATEVLARIEREWRPDLLMCWQPEAHPPPRGIEDVSVRTVALVSDWNVYYPVLERNLARFDVVLTDKPGTRVFERAGIPAHRIRPLYSQIAPIHFPRDLDKDIDVLFIGNLNHAAHVQRAEYLERLAKLADRYRIVITTGIEGDAYGELMSRARIVFNHSIRGEMNLRVFETMASRSLAMLEEENEEARDWFQDRKQIVFYNATNFEEVLTHYLDNPDEASNIAIAGHETIEDMCGERTLDELIESANRLPSSARPFRNFSERDRLLQNALMYGRLPIDRWRPYVAGLFGHLLEHFPEDADIHAAYVHFLLGASEQDWTRIEHHARRATEIDDDSLPFAWNLLQVWTWRTNTNPTETDWFSLLEKNNARGAGVLLGNQADPFWSRCYATLAHTGHVPAEMFHAEVLVRSTVDAANFDAALDRVARAEALDSENRSTIMARASLLRRKGDRTQAADYLFQELPRLPLDIAARETLIGWLKELGRSGDLQRVTAETLQILKAFPETV